MYDGAYAGMVLTGMCSLFLLIPLIFGWRSMEDWFNRIFLCIASAFYIVIFAAFWRARNAALEREPVISSYITIRMGERAMFLITDSTLRCSSGNPDRFTVMKKGKKMISSEQAHCIHYNKTMIHHVDQSCTKTTEELQAESMIEYLNAPL
ncbi:MAG: hypothetical protein J6W52_03060 [Bacteroidaceae bacterium]|nr:hypothetical protein [Bacteroidaceae bacterium]